MDGLATSPLLSGESLMLHSGQQNRKWPNCGPIDYITPAVLGVPNALDHGRTSEVA